MIIFTLRRILLFIVTLFLLTFVGLQFELFHSTRAVTVARHCGMPGCSGLMA